MGRKLFGTDGIRGKANIYPITPEMVVRIGRSFAKWVKSETSLNEVIIGMDTRESSQMLADALASGLLSMGLDVIFLSVVPTPAVSVISTHKKCAGIMITASHNPSEDNGIKFFVNGEKLRDEDESKIESLFDTDISYGSQIGKKTIMSSELYMDSFDNISLKGFKVVLDCANGAAYRLGPDIFRKMATEVIVINDTPDGKNINDGCGALYPEKVRDIVIGHHADVGIAFDGDADRAIFIDEKGNLVDGDAMLRLFAIYLKKHGDLDGSTIVVNEYSNFALDEGLKDEGISVQRIICGDRYISKKLIENGWVFGGEESGHFIFRDHAPTGDGILSAVMLLNILKHVGRSLSELVSGYKPYPKILKNSYIEKKVPLDRLQKTQELIKEHNKLGRVFVRYSGTENKVRVLVEGRGDIEGAADQIIRCIKDEVKQCKQ